MIDHVSTGPDQDLAEQGNAYVLANKVRFWLWACAKSGRELISFTASNRTHMLQMRENMFDRDALARWKTTSLNLRDEQTLSVHSLVNALAHLLVWGEAAAPNHPPLADALAAATHLQKEARQLRNMFEHADEYARGVGRRQSEYVREGEITSGDQVTTTTADAPSLMVTADDILIGNHLSVAAALREVEVIEQAFASYPWPGGRAPA